MSTFASPVIEKPRGTASLPRLNFPDDPALPAMQQFIDPDWTLSAFQEMSVGVGCEPARVRLRHFVHNPGRSALVCYEVEWEREAYLPPELFVFKIEKDKASERYRYPADPRLPGLAAVAEPEAARRIINRHVLQFPTKMVRVEQVRYRPEYRAVLRHRLSKKISLYARVMRRAEYTPFLAAQAGIEQSGFKVPRLTGKWAEGGVVWLTRVPGRNLRDYLRRGKQIDPDLLLNGLETLWNAPTPKVELPSFSLMRAYRRARRSFRYSLQEPSPARRYLREAMKGLDDFVREWRPTVLAHNDFYDDQLILTQERKLALVDYEEAGPGDPMLDIGNFLAHLSWSVLFGSKRAAASAQRFQQELRGAALARFGWPARELALREAVCLFRTATNAIRHPRADWEERLTKSLAQVLAILG